MLMVEKKSKRPKRDRTQFRRTLNKLMVERDIYFWKDLRVALSDIGYEIGQPRLSQYLNGQRDPEDLEEFFDAIGRALDLTEEEKMRLAYSYAYPGSGVRSGPTEETYRKAEEAEKIIRGDETVEGEVSNRTEGHRA